MMRVRVASGKALVALVALFIICASGGLDVPPAAAEEVPLVPAVYVFGDSTVDVGNNKYLPGNFTPPFPYGIDFPGSGPNGRFSNGYNMADSISRLLGFNMSPPAYLSLTPETSREILKGFGGVNYASGGSGILDITGNASLPLSKQVEYFAVTKSKMIEKSGGNSTAIDALLSKSLFLISDGGNDVFELLQNLGYIGSFYADLRSNYTKHVQTLYGLGARRFGVIGVPPMGCLPGVRAKFPFGDPGCGLITNNLAWRSNVVLGEVMEKLASSLPGMRYSVGSSYNLVMSYMERPEFKDVKNACCGDGKFNAQTLCMPNSTYCVNRDDHLFWDAVHSTQATSNKGAEDIYAAPVEQGFAAPINFKQLLLDDERAVPVANLLMSE